MTTDVELLAQLREMDEDELKTMAEMLGLTLTGSESETDLRKMLIEHNRAQRATPQAPARPERRPLNTRGWIAGDNLSIGLNVVSIGVALWPGMDPTTAYWLFLVATGWDTIEEVKETWPAWIVGLYDNPRILVLRTVSLILNVLVIVGLLAPSLFGWSPNLMALAIVRALDLVIELIIKRMTRKTEK